MRGFETFLSFEKSFERGMRCIRYSSTFFKPFKRVLCKGSGEAAVPTMAQTKDFFCHISYLELL